ncbi:unnamed protein product [Malus baccata var. baccata]
MLLIRPMLRTYNYHVYVFCLANSLHFDSTLIFRWNINPNNNTNGGITEAYVNDDAIFNSKECYACTQVGVPVFHSTRCDPIHQPHLQWERSAGSSMTRVHTPTTLNCGPHDLTRTRAIDPRSQNVKRWNRVVLMARGMALAVDPLFFYVIALSQRGGPCFYMDVALALVVTLVRTCLDALHLAHILLQFKLAYVSSESMVIGCGKLVWDSGEIACHYMRSLRGFWLDAFVILPIPQKTSISRTTSSSSSSSSIGSSSFDTSPLSVFKPPFESSACGALPSSSFFFTILASRSSREGLSSGSDFGTGSCLATGSDLGLGLALEDRGTNRLGREGAGWSHRGLRGSSSVTLWFLFVPFIPKLYHSVYLAKRLKRVTGYIFAYGNIWWRFKLNIIAYLTAAHVHTPFKYGIYQPLLDVYAGNTLAVRILYPIYWGLINIGSFANNLTPTSDWRELIFSCLLTLAGLGLFITLIGNIQIFLHMMMANKKKMQLKYRDMEWWMQRRQLPSHLRKRARYFQRHSWAAMQGQDELELIQHFPDGLRRDIKRYLCLDLVKKVPLFHKLDDVILDNICDLVRPTVYSKGEKIIREGDPVQRMMFVVHGRIKRSQGLSKGFLATSVLEPGSFFGDELLSWCLRRPFLGRLPSSSATFTCLEPMEAFGLDADCLRYITDHFRYKFLNEELRWTARFYSSNWRTWAAVIIQLAWRRHRMRTKGPVVVQNGDIENRLRHYAAFFLSLKPHDHLE